MRTSMLLPLLLGCGGSTPEPTPATSRPTPATAGPATAAPEPHDLFGDTRANVRFLHLASASAEVALEGFTGTDTSTPAFPRLPFKSAAPYQSAALGDEGLALLARGQGLTEASSAAHAAPDTYHTVVVLNAADDPAKLQIATVPDDAPRAQGEAVMVRFFHAILGTGPIDVCVPGEGPRAPAVSLFPAVEYGTFRPALQLPGALPVRVSLRRASEAECSGRLVGAIDLSAPDGVSFAGQNLTIYALGRTSGRPEVDPEAAISIDQPPQSAWVTLPVRAR